MTTIADRSVRLSAAMDCVEAAYRQSNMGALSALNRLELMGAHVDDLTAEVLELAAAAGIPAIVMRANFD